MTSILRRPTSLRAREFYQQTCTACSNSVLYQNCNHFPFVSSTICNPELMVAWLLLATAILLTFIMVRMRSGYFKPLARIGIGAFMLLVVQCLCAPASAWAGCNHLVISRTDAARMPSLIDHLMGDFAGQREPLQTPPPPCTGAWCSGQPATPAVPAGVLDWGIESWVWWAPVAGSVPTARSFASPSSLVLHPAHCGSAVFHPPRFLPSA
jgi:hypothetical protein